MRYLFDTCAISEMVKKHPNEKVVQWIRECDEDSIFLSVLTLGEIQKGISKLSDSKRRVKIQKWLDTDLKERFSERILPITHEIALTWGIVEGESLNKGRPLPTIDALIGATAITHNLTVVTRNVLDIQATGARVLDLWTL